MRCRTCLSSIISAKGFSPCQATARVGQAYPNAIPWPKEEHQDAPRKEENGGIPPVEVTVCRVLYVRPSPKLYSTRDPLGSNSDQAERVWPRAGIAQPGNQTINCVKCKPFRKVCFVLETIVLPV